jgi:polyphosphate kinase
VADEHLAKRLHTEILGSYLKDNVKVRILGPDGNYTRAPLDGDPFCAQDYLMALSAL